MKVKLGFAVALSLFLVLPAVADEWDLHGYSWAIVLDGDSVELMVGDSHRSHRRIDKARESFDEPFVWVERDRDEWVISNPEVVAELREIMQVPELDRARDQMDAEKAAIEDSVRELERSVQRMERKLDRVSLEEAMRIAEAAREIDREQLEQATRRMERGVRELERALEVMRDRVENEAVPLIEKSIRDGKATRVR